MLDLAKRLAHLLLTSGEQAEEFSFPVEGRRARIRVRIELLPTTIQEDMEKRGSPTVSFSPPGRTCPTCAGAGTV